MKIKFLLAALLLPLIAGCQFSCIVRDPKSEVQLLDRLAAGVVIVSTDTGFGSGTTIYSTHEYSLVITNYHVIEGAKGVWVKHGGLKVVATVETYDADKDLALLMTEFTGLPAIKIAGNEPLEHERIYVIGNPLGKEDTVADGILSSKNSHPYDVVNNLWQVTSFVIYGSSGGGVFNHEGELVAIPAMVQLYPTPIYLATPGDEPMEAPLKAMVPISQIGYAIPLSSIKEFLRFYKL